MDRFLKAGDDDRKRAFGELIEVLAEIGRDSEQAYSGDVPSVLPLQRAFTFSAWALGDPAQAANLILAIHQEKRTGGYEDRIDYMLTTFTQALLALHDPDAEADVLHSAFIGCVTGDAVESLVLAVPHLTRTASPRERHDIRRTITRRDFRRGNREPGRV